MFYKPLFTCAASSKELIIAHHLTILIAVGRYLPDLWTTDAEMIAVATMSDVSVARKGKQKEVELMNWGQARPGQCIVLLEVIGALRSARMAQKEMNTVGLQFGVRSESAFNFSLGIERISHESCQVCHQFGGPFERVAWCSGNWLSCFELALTDFLFHRRNRRVFYPCHIDVSLQPSCWKSD